MVLLYQKSVWIAILHFSLYRKIKKSGSSEKEAARKDLSCDCRFIRTIGVQESTSIACFSLFCLFS
ncbi:MAG: hypothetical protein RR580_05935, partial [Christensenellaceae bacterium]